MRLIKETTTSTTTVKEYEGDETEAGLEGAAEIVKVEESRTAAAQPAAAAPPTAAPEPAALEGVAEAEAYGDGGDHLGETGDDDDDDVFYVIVDGRRCYCPPGGKRPRVRHR